MVFQFPFISSLKPLTVTHNPVEFPIKDSFHCLLLNVALVVYWFQKYHHLYCYRFKYFSMVKIKSYVTEPKSFYDQDLISRHHKSNSANPKSPCNKVEQKQSLYLGIKATQH